MPVDYTFPKKRSSESGLTLIECLVAIVVIALTTATMTPMVLFAVATRVQNQKAEQALSLAQSEIDRVRLAVEQGGDYGDYLGELSLVRLPDATPPTDITAAVAPQTFIDSTATASAVTEARRVDTDGDGDTDFAVQLFRTEGIEVSPTTAGVLASTPVAFSVGVRVYDSRAAASLPSSLKTDEAGLSFTSGEGDRTTRPLAVLYSQITQGDRVGSLCQYWDFADSTAANRSDLLCD